MPGGYVAAIVIAALAVVAAIVIGVLYAVNDKSKKCKIKVLPLPSKGPASASYKSVSLAEKTPTALKPMEIPAPVFNTVPSVLVAPKRLAAKTAPVESNTRSYAQIEELTQVTPEALAAQAAEETQAAQAARAAHAAWATQESQTDQAAQAAHAAWAAQAAQAAQANQAVEATNPVQQPDYLLPEKNVGEASTGGITRAELAASASAMYATTRNGVSVTSALKPGPSTPPAEHVETMKKFQMTGLPAVIQHVEGASLQHDPKTVMKQTGNFQNDFHDGNLHFFDPESAEKLDKAMAMTGTPQRFFSSDTEEAITRKTALLKNLATCGKVDASIEEVLSLTAPIVATKNAMLRAVNSARSLSSSVVLQLPRRFLFDTPLTGSRMPSIMPTVNSLRMSQDNITPGEDLFFTMNNCENTCGAKNFEPY